LKTPTVTIQDERGSVALTTGWKVLKPEVANLETDKGGKLTVTSGWKVLKKEAVNIETSAYTVKGTQGGWKVLTPKTVLVKDDKGEFALPTGWSVLKKDPGAPDLEEGRPGDAERRRDQSREHSKTNSKTNSKGSDGSTAEREEDREGRGSPSKTSPTTPFKGAQTTIIDEEQRPSFSRSKSSKSKLLERNTSKDKQSLSGGIKPSPGREIFGRSRSTSKDHP